MLELRDEVPELLEAEFLVEDAEDEEPLRALVLLEPMSWTLTVEFWEELRAAELLREVDELVVVLLEEPEVVEALELRLLEELELLETVDPEPLREEALPVLVF